MGQRQSARSHNVARTALVEPVYEALKERIMDQSFEPGARLNIDALAAELKVSQTPVREALTRLAAEHLVSFAPFKGYSVMPSLTQNQVAELLHVRRLLESDGARLAATRVILAELRAMKRELEAMESLRPTPRFRDFRVYSQHDQQFHELVVAASDNSILLETYRRLHVHVQLARLVHQMDEVDYVENGIEHEAIYEALRAHDADAAERAVRRHIDRFEYQSGELLEAALERTYSGT